MHGRLAAPLALVAMMQASLWAGGLAVGQERGHSVLVGAGDIGSCRTTGDEDTAALLGGINGTVATFGDNAYESGTSAEFARCYDPSWGQFKARTKPSVGDGEYETAGASGYFNYFGEAAGDPQEERLHRRPLPPPALLLFRAWQLLRGRALLGGALRGGRRRGALRPRPQLRTLRATNAERAGGPGPRDPPVRCGHRWQEPDLVRRRPGQQ